jgi:Uma2 family endonuclease
MGTATRMTADEYYAVSVEGDRKQLVDGEIVVNEPKGLHARLQARMCHPLMSWAEAGSGRGEVFMPTDVRMDDYNVYGPDLLWLSDRNLRAAFPNGLDAYPERVPDLCVEIRSESTWRYDIGAKKRVYEQGGLPELWLIDSAAVTVLVYRRSTSDSPTFDLTLELGRGAILTSPQFPGFELRIDSLFAD